MGAEVRAVTLADQTRCCFHKQLWTKAGRARKNPGLWQTAEQEPQAICALLLLSSPAVSPRAPPSSKWQPLSPHLCPLLAALLQQILPDHQLHCPVAFSRLLGKVGIHLTFSLLELYLRHLLPTSLDHACTYRCPGWEHPEWRGLHSHWHTECLLWGKAGGVQCPTLFLAAPWLTLQVPTVLMTLSLSVP